MKKKKMIREICISIRPDIDFPEKWQCNTNIVFQSRECDTGNLYHENDVTSVEGLSKEELIEYLLIYVKCRRSDPRLK
jgi:hypothetical protein